MFGRISNKYNQYSRKNNPIVGTSDTTTIYCYLSHIFCNNNTVRELAKSLKIKKYNEGKSMSRIASDFYMPKSAVRDIIKNK